jgi:hypothetical protein
MFFISSSSKISNDYFDRIIERINLPSPAPRVSFLCLHYHDFRSNTMASRDNCNNSTSLLVIFMQRDFSLTTNVWDKF